MPPPAVKSAERTLDLLEFIGRHANAASHSDLAVGLGIPKGSLSKLLATIRSRGYVAFDAEANVYRLGKAVFDLVEMGRASVDAAALSLPILQWVTDVTREASSYTALRDDDEMERICGVDGDQPLSYRMNNRARFPLYSSSGGKAVLAAMSAKDRDAYLAGVKLKKLTASTVPSIAKFRRQLAQIRDEGVAVSRNEHTVGVIALAVAITPVHVDGPIGALTVVIPEVRFNARLEILCKKTLKTAAARLEQGLRFAVTRAG